MIKTLVKPVPSQLSSFLSDHKVYARTYALLVALYGFSFLPFLRVAQISESLLVLLFLGLLALGNRHSPIRQVLVRDPVFRIMLLFTVFLAGARAWYALSLPVDLEPNTRDMRYYLKPFMVIILATGLALQPINRAWQLLLIGWAGLLVYLGLNFDAHEWQRALAGRRVDFGIHNAQHTGLFFGSSLLALICFAPRILMRARSPLGFAILALPLIASIALAFTGTLAAQTRAVWLGLVASIVILVILLASQVRKRHWNPKVLWGSALGIFIVLAGIFVALHSLKTVEHRINASEINLEDFLAPPSEHGNPKTSSGVRLYSWRVALGWISERPLAGWGAGTVDDKIDQSNFFDRWFKGFGHLHNSYFETLYAHGLIGTGLLGALIVWIGIATWRCFRTGNMPLDVFVFAFSYFGFWLVINMFESYIIYSTGQYMNALIVGFIYTFYLSSRVTEKAHEH